MSSEAVTPPEEDWEVVTLEEDGWHGEPVVTDRTVPHVDNLHPFVDGLAEKCDEAIEAFVDALSNGITVEDVVESGVDGVVHAVKGGVDGVGRFLLVVAKALKQTK